MAVMVIMLPTFDGMVSRFVLMVLNLSSEVVSNQRRIVIEWGRTNPRLRRDSVRYEAGGLAGIPNRRPLGRLLISERILQHL